MVQFFVNGDSHTAKVYGEPGLTATEILAREFDCTIENIALPGGSNQRIIRTTQQKLQELDPERTVIIIGWSSFERTEWFYRDQWYPVCGDPGYPVDDELRNLWQQHIDSWWADDNHESWRRQQDQHHAIWMFHNLLHDLGYQFLFYQGCRTFFFDGCPQQDQPFRFPWHEDTWVHDPYVKLVGSERVADSFSYHGDSLGLVHSDDRAHYGADAHRAWADRLRPLISKKLQNLQRKV